MMASRLIDVWWGPPIALEGHNERVLQIAKKRLQRFDPRLWRTATSGNFRQIRRIVDVGSCIGYYAIMWKECWPDAEVLVVEPSSWNFPYLLKNTQHLANVSYMQAALSDEPGEVEIGSRGGSLGLISVYGRHKKYKETVPTVRLDDIIEERVDLLKIDVEDHEMHVLRGALSVLENHRPICFIEVHDKPRAGHTYSDVAELVKKYEYKRVGTLSCDAIFWPQEMCNALRKRNWL